MKQEIKFEWKNIKIWMVTTELLLDKMDSKLNAIYFQLNL